MMSLSGLAKHRGVFNKIFRHVGYVKPHLSLSYTSSEIDNLEKIEQEIEAQGKLLEESQIEKLRNRSGLQDNHYNIQHGKVPYKEPIYDFHNSAAYKRRTYARYGIESGVNPSIAWPDREELKALKEYESIAHPHTVPELIAKVQKERELEEEARREREMAVIERLKTRNEKIEAFNNKIRKKCMQAKEAKARKEKMIEEIRMKIGYDIDVKHERFKEEFIKMEEEQKKKLRLMKKESKKEKIIKLAEKANTEATGEKN